MKLLAVLLTVVFVTLKLMGYIHWSWSWVWAVSLVIAVCAGIVSGFED